VAKPSMAESKMNLSAAKFIRASDDEFISGKVIIASDDKLIGGKVTLSRR
jgi:hypothetical protein